MSGIGAARYGNLAGSKRLDVHPVMAAQRARFFHGAGERILAQQMRNVFGARDTA